MEEPERPSLWFIKYLGNTWIGCIHGDQYSSLPRYFCRECFEKLRDCIREEIKEEVRKNAEV